jgi:hypothetical protein
MLTRHVMGSCENVSHRRAAQDHVHAIRINDSERDVATTTSDEVVRIRTLCLFNVGSEPFLYAFYIDALHGH